MNQVRSGFAPRRVSSGPSLLNFRISDQFLRHIDFGAWLVWTLVQTFFPLSASAALYMLAMYFTGATVLRYRTMGGSLLACWPMFLLPILAFISALWAPSANEAIRKGLLLVLTGVIGIYVARQLTARQIIYSIFAMNALAAVASMISPDLQGTAATGVFSQKNVLAFSMFLAFTSGIVLFFDNKAPWFLRLLVVAILPIAFWMMFRAESATIVILSIPMGMALAVQVLMWGGMRRIRHLRSVVALFGVCLVAVAVIVLFGVFGFDAYEAVLGSVGKDSTLTGRTVLWAQAERIMEQNPWTGLGANGFWRPEVGEANAILRFFHYQQYTNFSFHNSYLENGVQFGYPGMYATYFLGFWCVYRALRTWLMNQDLHNAYFMFMALMILVRSFTEVDLAAELGWSYILIFICAARQNPKPQRHSGQQHPQAPHPAVNAPHPHQQSG